MALPEQVEEIRLEEVVHQDPGRDEPAVDGVSLIRELAEPYTLRGIACH